MSDEAISLIRSWRDGDEVEQRETWEALTAMNDDGLFRRLIANLILTIAVCLMWLVARVHKPTYDEFFDELVKLQDGDAQRSQAEYAQD